MKRYAIVYSNGRRIIATDNHKHFSDCIMGGEIWLSADRTTMSTYAVYKIDSEGNLLGEPIFQNDNKVY